MEVDEQLGTDDVDILQSNLEYAFGVSIDDNSGIAQQFTSSPESLLQLQGLVRAALSSMTGKDEIDHSLLLDELIWLAVNMIKSGDGSVANADDALSTLLPQFGLALSPVASSALDYLVGLRNRCDFLLAKSKAPTPLCRRWQSRVVGDAVRGANYLRVSDVFDSLFAVERL
uniref:MMS19 nucleotide excision repair protein n=1 Tax=Globodera pallida TaxID=36090 RepID=A0A183BZT9_GLOPA